ncbi:biotin-dependent carboxyltransferase family protein [Pseudoalteromonas sp. SSDWG2]|uniref:5-oxoprolinase subunit C family protein n=1 Tax=Pseudoalteromonas sp. SSDWG2 TaxID=3139391 RepID=UPI003BAA05B2
MLEIIKSGPQLSIQDFGRFGHRHLGISQCGAADADAMRIANILLGNDENTPVLEITLGMASFTFTAPTHFALCGADMNANLDGQKLYCGWNYTAKAHQQLTFATGTQGLRCYLAISGGFKTQAILGSASTDIMAGFGLSQGHLLQSSDTLSYTSDTSEFVKVGAQLPSREGPIHFIIEPREHGLTKNVVEQLCHDTWSIGAQSNRMGLRLTPSNQLCSLRHCLSIRSTAVSPGTIQLPPSGEPIVLLNDCQTTGGYPIIGQVIAADLSRLGQLRGGDSIEFKAITAEQAAQMNADHYIHFNKLRIATRYQLSR